MMMRFNAGLSMHLCAKARLRVLELLPAYFHDVCICKKRVCVYELMNATCLPHSRRVQEEEVWAGREKLNIRHSTTKTAAAASKARLRPSRVEYCRKEREDTQQKGHAGHTNNRCAAEARATQQS